MRGLALVAVVVLSGCAVEAEDDTASAASSGSCTALTGSYVVSWRERAGGSCGPITDMVVQMADPPRLSPGCTGTIDRSTDKCSVSTQQDCTDPDSGARFKGNTTCKVARDGNSATCVFTMNMVTDGGCFSTYDVIYRRP